MRAESQKHKNIKPSGDEKWVENQRQYNRDMSDDGVELKKEINNLIWMRGPGRLTLEEAEDRACRILDIIEKRPDPNFEAEEVMR